MAELFSTRAADAIQDLVLNSRRNPSSQADPSRPPVSGLRAPIVAILLEDLVNGGTADGAVLRRETTTQIQEISFLGAQPTGGTFTLQFKGQTTVPINWNAAPSEMQTALENLSTIGPKNVKVSLGTQKYTNAESNAVTTENPGVWIVQFVGVFAKSQTPPPLMIPASSLTAPITTVIVDATSNWVDTGDVETIVATIPVGSPTPMRAGAQVACVWFPGVGFGFPGVECREFAVAGY